MNGTVGIRSILIFLVLLLLSPMASAGTMPTQSRQTGATLPDWSEGDSWSYYTEIDNVDPYGIVIVTIPDENNNDVNALLCNVPDVRKIWQTYTLETRKSTEYDMDLGEEIEETGTWVMRKGILGQYSCSNGEIVAQGTYVRNDNNTGIMTYKISNLHFDGNDIGVKQVMEYTGDFNFTITINGIHTMTTNTPCQHWPPDWSSSPLNLSDTWTMDCTETEEYSDLWVASGDLHGSFYDNGTYHFVYNMDYNVTGVGPRIIFENTYPEAYQVYGEGTMNWDWSDDQGNSQNGNLNVAELKWYADEGDFWDAGWGIEYDNIKKLQWSTYGPPPDWNHPPEVIDAPPSAFNIDEGEEWTFDDYTVQDTDPGMCGDIGFQYSIQAVYDGEPALPNLTVDRDGVISLTPVQEDVADGFEVTLTVSDSCPDSVMSVDINFKINVKNVNDAPEVKKGAMKGFLLYENETHKPNWTLFDAFSDRDLGISAFTGQQYDPAENLDFKVQNNGYLVVDIDEATGEIEFTARDGDFPEDVEIIMNIVAEDRHGMTANDTLNVYTLHTNHKPVVIADEDGLEMEEDTTETVDLEDIFSDRDVGDPQYPTKDGLLYYAWNTVNISTTITGHRIKISPYPNWSGEDVIRLRATDYWGAFVEFELEVNVNPINDAPTSLFQNPQENAVHHLDEDREGVGGFGRVDWISLQVETRDVDKDTVYYNWTVRKESTGEVYTLAEMTEENEFRFETDFKGEFLDGKFTGGDVTEDYMIKVTVTDGVFTVDAGSWHIQVHNVNRPPTIDGYTVSLRKKSGVMVPQIKQESGMFKLKYDKVYQFSILGKVSDVDEEGISGLECDWSTDQMGFIATGSCADLGAINISAGKSKKSVPYKLEPGAYVIYINVTDEKGDQTTRSFLVEVEKEPPGYWETVDQMWILMIAVSILIIVLAILTGFLLALKAQKREVARLAAEEQEPARKIAIATAPEEKAARKPVQRKRKPKPEPETEFEVITEVGKVEERPRKAVKKVPRKKKPEKRAWYEELPEDWE
jgi:hypothetical protein